MSAWKMAAMSVLWLHAFASFVMYWKFVEAGARGWRMGGTMLPLAMDALILAWGYAE